ncbi:aconitase X catalytic domain-containing protein [Methanohalophilus sp.]|uniref:aconitase X catalytic domain-containing protein n=1 Tax=Methanohalophilus sp. TaxID=1966352 RepID=UPI002611F779|nr:aconitase X catalytic domain-containing protein [Methanohalophilus sp.]MDK2892604.1 mevalonate 5-phosphate dehydratase large subunit [Methanohalophilus sp.]
MYLTTDEERILEGEEGETLRKAMEILVALGDIYGADCLIPIKSAQIAGVSYKTIGDAGLEWISDLKGHVKVPSVLNPAGMDMIRWNEMGISRDFAKKQKQIVEAYGRLGINTMCTCTPYYLKGFSVGYGDHLAWSESSAVSYANSVIGARTNREGGPSALSAALVGKTANYGYHLDEKRIPNIGIRVECNLKGADYGALGYVAGKISGNMVPIFSLTSNPTNDELKSLGAAMAASGAVALYHVENVTPEARKMKYDFPEEVVVIERADIEEVYATVGGSDGNSECDVAAAGCPHCSPKELESIAQMIKGKTVDKEFWVFTSREVATKYPDLVETIEKSGAKVLCDTCMIVSPAANNFHHMAVNSGKAYSYIPGMCRINSTLCDLEHCIKKVVSDDN